MALNGDVLGTAIKNAVSALTPSEKQDLELAWQAIANEITDHIGNYLGMSPIGSIIAWHKDLSGTPTLPDDWAECNGQTITDTDSPYYGVALPDLNGEGRFLRGDSTSGTDQDDALQGHHHGHYSIGAGGAGIYIDGNGDLILAAGTGGSVAGFTVSASHANLSTNNPIRTDNPKSDGSNGTPRTANETRPKNMSVVYIIRIK